MLLACGLLFPLISWLTFVISVIQARAGRHSSGVYIPLVGPVVLDVWLAGTAAPGWTLCLPWLLDIGTLFFFAATPHWCAQWWKTSKFTRVFALNGVQGNQTVEISFHRGGHYLLWMRWQRAPGEIGILALGDTGSYLERDGRIDLRSHTGRERAFIAAGDGYLASDPGSQVEPQLQGWHLQWENLARRASTD